MFRFTMEPSSGSYSQYLAKSTHLVQCGYMEVVERLSVLWLHSMTCETCALCTAHTSHRSYYAAITPTTSVQTPSIHIEPRV